MFGLGAPELLLILVITLVVFGPGKLPSIGGALGKSLREFKDEVNVDDKKTDMKEIHEIKETDQAEPSAESSGKV